MTQSSNNWQEMPGAFDSLNTFYLPDLTISGMPVIHHQDIATPERLVRYGVRVARLKKPTRSTFS